MIFCFTTWTWTWTWTWTIVVVVSCRSCSCSCRSRSCRSRSNGTLERPLEMLNVECSFKILVTLGRSPTMELWKVSGTRLKPGSRWWKWYAPHHNWITRTPTGGLQKLTKNFTKNLIFRRLFCCCFSCFLISRINLELLDSNFCTRFNKNQQKWE